MGGRWLGRHVAAREPAMFSSNRGLPIGPDKVHRFASGAWSSCEALWLRTVARRNLGGGPLQKVGAEALPGSPESRRLRKPNQIADICSPNCSAVALEQSHVSPTQARPPGHRRHTRVGPPANALCRRRALGRRASSHHTVIGSSTQHAEP